MVVSILVAAIAPADLSTSGDALVKDLSHSFANALGAMGLLGEVKDPVATLWDGKSFAPMAGILGKAAASGDWTPEHFAKFLWILSETPLTVYDRSAYTFLKEAYGTDPVLSAFGEAGISLKFFFGGGFGDADPGKLGHLFMEHFSALGHDLGHAPEVIDGAPTMLHMAEGGTLDLALAKIFADADGDTLQFRAEGGGDRLDWSIDQDGVLHVSPGYSAAGSHDFVLYASDGTGEVAHKLSLAVDEAGAGTRLMTADLKTVLGSAETLDDALAMVARSRAIDIRDQSAVGTANHTVLTDNLTLNAQAEIHATLTLGDAARVLTLRGPAQVSLTGNALDNYVTASTGDDRIDAMAGNDQIFGGAGNDSLDGGNGNDKLYGGEGDDWLVGGEGDDQLFGDAGSDWLRGGAGRDQATGGAGADVFEFVRGDGTLTIRDAALGEDIIRLTGFAEVTDAATLLAQATVQEFADFTRLTLGSEVLNLSGLKAADITDVLFDFA